jgi:predicted nucleic acid-binding protein
VTAFLDTNILVYQVDNKAPAKQQRAQSLTALLYQQNEAVISTQVLQEFYNTATGKLRIPSSVSEGLARSFAKGRVVQLVPSILFSAMQRHASSQFYFWDALIVEAALAAGCKTLYSEDMQHGLVVNGMTIENPFVGL